MNDEDAETVDSQKLSKRDRKEIEEGACVNCAIVSISILFLLLMFFVAL